MIFKAIKSVFKAAPAKTVDDIMDKDNGLLAKFGGFVNDLHYSDAEKAEKWLMRWRVLPNLLRPP